MGKRIYFISDLHLGHKGIMKFKQRTHDTLEDMHIAMMEQWNEKVRKHTDIVWVLGDVCMDIKEMHWLDKMNGEKRLILGNHDQLDLGVYRKYFSQIHACKVGYHGLILTHIPIHPNELVYRNWQVNVHGHIHHEEKNNLGPKYFNVNVDIRGYAPTSLEELREEIKHESNNSRL